MYVIGGMEFVMEEWNKTLYDSICYVKYQNHLLKHKAFGLLKAIKSFWVYIYTTIHMHTIMTS